MTYAGCTWSELEPDACGMCTGEYCAQHAANKCDCEDVTQRHDDGLLATPQAGEEG